MLVARLRLMNVGLKRCFAAIPRNIFVKSGGIPTLRHHSSDSGGATSVTILNSEPDAPLMIDSYSQFGFRLNNGLSIIGPMVIFPKTILSWNVGGPEDVCEESLSLFYVLEPKLDIIVIGIGVRGGKINPKVVTSLRRYGVNVEILPTDAACATFNFLNAEQRSVVGALLPPQFMTVTDDDVVQSQIRRKELFRLKDE